MWGKTKRQGASGRSYINGYFRLLGCAKMYRRAQVEHVRRRVCGGAVVNLGNTIETLLLCSTLMAAFGISWKFQAETAP